MDFNGILDFLKKLKRNNNREWFDKNKPKYLEAKDVFDVFVADLLEQMIKFDSSLAGQDPKKLTFRIYRDVRFSKDKTPYKDHLSAAFSPVGKGMGKPGYYFQLEPGNKSFVGIGLFQPIPEYLAQIRQEIDYSGDRLTALVKEKKFKSNFTKFWDEDALKNAPKGYPKDHPHADWLRLKSFIVTHEFKDSEVTDKKFIKKLAEVMRSGKPLNDFLREAIA
jgi:uncharacterized protein (TIGR02453 family)